MTKQQANDIPIVDILAREGFMPKKQLGRNWWYVSPIRFPEKTASFKVDTVINKWYDHGIGKGGGTLDLFILLHQNSDVDEALDRLSVIQAPPCKAYMSIIALRHYQKLGIDRLIGE